MEPTQAWPVLNEESNRVPAASHRGRNAALAGLSAAALVLGLFGGYLLTRDTGPATAPAVASSSRPSTPANAAPRATTAPAPAPAPATVAPTTPATIPATIPETTPKAPAPTIPVTPPAPGPTTPEFGHGTGHEGEAADPFGHIQGHVALGLGPTAAPVIMRNITNPAIVVSVAVNAAGDFEGWVPAGTYQFTFDPYPTATCGTLPATVASSGSVSIVLSCIYD